MENVQIHNKRIEMFFVNSKYPDSGEEILLEAKGWECFTINGFRFWARDVGIFEIVVSDALTGYQIAKGVWPDTIYEAKKKVENNYEKYIAKAKKILRKRRFRPKAIESNESA